MSEEALFPADFADMETLVFDMNNSNNGGKNAKKKTYVFTEDTDYIEQVEQETNTKVSLFWHC